MEACGSTSIRKPVEIYGTCRSPWKYFWKLMESVEVGATPWRKKIPGTRHRNRWTSVGVVDVQEARGTLRRSMKAHERIGSLWTLYKLLDVYATCGNRWKHIWIQFMEARGNSHSSWWTSWKLLIPPERKNGNPHLYFYGSSDLLSSTILHLLAGKYIRSTSHRGALTNIYGSITPKRINVVFFLLSPGSLLVFFVFPNRVPTSQHSVKLCNPNSKSINRIFVLCGSSPAPELYGRLPAPISLPGTGECCWIAAGLAAVSCSAATWVSVRHNLLLWKC